MAQDDAAQADRPARGHGRSGHLPRRRRPVPFMTGTDHPGRRRHRHDEVAEHGAGRAAADPVAVPARRRRRRARRGRRRRRPRARHAPRRLPPRACSRCRSAAAARWRGGRPTRAASSRSTGCAVSRSLRRSLRRYEVRVDTAFAAVVEACADPDRARRLDHRRHPAAYVRLHEPRVGPQRRGLGRRRPRRRALRRRDRRAVRRRVDVPPPHRRVEGRAGRRSSTLLARRRRRTALLDVQWPTDAPRVARAWWPCPRRSATSSCSRRRSALPAAGARGA